MSELIPQPADPGIPTLATVLDARALAPYLAPIVQQSTRTLADAHIMILQHHRGSRCTIQIAAAQQAWIAKVYASDRADVFAYMRQLAAHGFAPDAPFSIPQPIGYVPELRLLLLEKVDGMLAKNFFLMTEQEPQTDAARRCARWLAHFHRDAPRHGQVFDLPMHFVAMERWTNRLARLGEPLARKARALFATLLVAARTLQTLEPRAAHSSYSHAQVIFANARTVTFDWDGYDVADPARDVARFIVALRRLALGRLISIRALDMCAQTFRETYAELAGPALLANLPFFEAALCLQLAKYDLHHQVSHWLQKVEALLDEGMRVLDSGA